MTKVAQMGLFQVPDVEKTCTLVLCVTALTVAVTFGACVKLTGEVPLLPPRTVVRMPSSPVDSYVSTPNSCSPAAPIAK